MWPPTFTPEAPRAPQNWPATPTATRFATPGPPRWWEGTQGGDVTLCGLPLFHTNAVIVTGLVQFSRGAQVVLLTPQGYRDPAVLEHFYEIVEHFGAVSFSAVPTVYSRLLEIPRQGRDLSSLRFAICGAAPMPTQVFEAFQEATGIRILEGYGLTEGTCVSSCNPKDGQRRIGSIGFRVPYQKMKVIQLDANGRRVRDCQPNEAGVIAIQGPNVFSGYVQEEANRGIRPEAGWLNTGDLGRCDAEGYFWITGRHKDLIIRGGHNIDPAVIEEALHSHPSVALAAAVGRPDPDLGEVPVAFVTLKPGASSQEGDLLAHCRQHLDEPAAQPKAIRILSEIPATPVGKVYKPALRKMAAE
ncbi:MAG: AMP-binding protein [Acidobacteriota bacterium]